MWGEALSLIGWGYGLAAVAYGVLTLHLLRQALDQRPPDRTALAVLAAATLTTLWAALSVWAAASDAGSAWWLLAGTLDTLRYAAWFGFVVLLFRADQRTSQAGRWMAPWAFLLPTLALLALLWAARTTGDASGGVGLVFLSLMVLPVLGLVLVEQLFRNLPDDSRWSAKPICLGLAGTFLFDVYLFSQAVLFKSLDWDAWSVRGVVHALMMPLLMVSSTRHKNWIGKIQVSRQVVFHSATLFIAGLYLLFIAGVGYYVRYFGGDWGRALQVALVFAALVGLVVLAVSGSVRARLRVFLGKHFFRYRFDYREEWLKFTHTLSSQTEPAEMGGNVIRGLADMLESPAGVLWLTRPGEGVYRQVARWNMPHTPDTEPADSPLLAFMQQKSWVLNLEEYRAYPGRYEHLRLPAWLARHPQAWLLVPLWLGNDLLGFVVLASPRTPVDVNWEVNDLLKTAGRQAASFLGQMQATEALLESRKFEAFSKMSAFVVHDLKNIVTQLSLMVKNAKRLRNNPEFQADMLMTVENSLERMRQLMLQLREGATPNGSAVGVELAPIADALVQAAAKRGRLVELDVNPHVATRGQPERMERVVGHLVHNALDATDGNQGRVWVKVDRYGSHARVEVGDNGQGMTQEFIETRLFKPFQTTKAAGMGIGAYESFQYVQELGGKINVKSDVGVGTVVTLLLPLIETFQASDLHRLEDE